MATGAKQLLSAFRGWVQKWFEPPAIETPASGLEVMDPQTLDFPSRLGKDRRSNRFAFRSCGSGSRRSSRADLNPDAIEAGDFSIDLAARSVTVRGQAVELTSAELEMLVFLTGHHKSVVTPNTMLATNWCGREVRQADFVRVLVSLRKKLDSVAGSTPSYIRTESWIFYNFSTTLAHRV